MRVAVLGSGGREHALVAALARSPAVEALFVVPGNAGTAGAAENVAGVRITDPAAVAAWVEEAGADLTVVGPEAPLVAGVADALGARGHLVVGPSAAAARIEGSKAFAKEVMAAAGVPTAAAAAFADPAEALAALGGFGPPWVVKADGLAAGKGVTVTADRAAAEAAVTDALVAGVHGAAGRVVLLEEHLDGPEASVFGLCDGERVVALAPARDYKRVGEGGRGPNTGGMGAYSPLADVPPEVVERVRSEILEPTVRELAARGAPYRGVLYAGLALTRGGPKVIEFNCRLGDPEAQAVLPRLASDPAALLLAAAEGRLDRCEVAWDPRACVTVVVASGGYPGGYRTGFAIGGLDDAAALDGVQVYHAGTAAGPGGEILTAGGRVLAVSALAEDVRAARSLAYQAAERIRFEGAYLRRDIAAW
ncbi:MAG TPA: phosphoribosylamine--glycine ligase [Actinomycetes bacterium]|nr:phosphoribosylamine--glycine ligase [Actinomycetes bacterium]